MDIERMQSNVQEASALLKSLSNPNRLLVLCALLTREHTAGELEALTAHVTAVIETLHGIYCVED